MGDRRHAKNKNMRQNHDETAPPSKKVRLSACEQNSPKQLKSQEQCTGYKALDEFLQAIKGPEKRNYVLTYLQQGGNCLDVLETLEKDLGVSPLTVFEVFNGILLQINANFHQYKKLTHTACQYLFNKHMELVNKMLTLTSTTQERLIALKLLTSIATISPVLAKEVLFHVNLNPSNLELLTKGGDKNHVRGAFIHFIMALIVDGHFATLSLVLEKKTLIARIINGLQYDNVDTVVLVLSVLKNTILENTAVSKTTKMQIFNTQTVKAIVNLYNWRGPTALSKKNKAAVVNEVQKTKVNEAVHSFLLVLCTSHKCGIIFKHYSLGLDKVQNSLMITVLQGLKNPWDHSYAGELVLKICQACPDLVKPIWTQLKPSLEPRWTKNWLNVMRFAGRLVEELQFEYVEHYLSTVNVHQIVEIVSSLVAPAGVLKTVIDKKHVYEKAAIKYHILRLLVNMMKSLENYLNKLKRLPHLDGEILTASMAAHVKRNFPDVRFVLIDWSQKDEDCSAAEYLETALDFLEKYQVLEPEMLRGIDSVIDVKEFLREIGENVGGKNVKNVQIKVVKLFLDLVPVVFKPKTDLFEIAVKLSLELYYDKKDLVALRVLRVVLENSGIFDGFLSEIDIWIDGVVNVKSYNEVLGDFLCRIINRVEDEVVDYAKKLFELRNGNFSSVLLALQSYIDEISESKPLKQYLNFVILGLAHLQVDLTAFSTVISELSFIPSSLQNYVENWKNLNPVVLHKCKGNVLEHFRKFSADFIEGEFENFDLDLYPNLKLNLLQASVFYLTKTFQGESVKENYKKNFKIYLNYLLSKNVFEDTRYVRAILAHDAILKGFNVLEADNFITELVVNFVRDLKNCNIDDYVVDYRRKSVSSLLKVFTKPQKYEKFVIAPEIFETLKLSYEDCGKLVEKFVTMKENKSFHSIICYCLNRMADLAKNDYELQPLDENVVKELSIILSILVKEQGSVVHNTSSALLNYLQTFPHNVAHVEMALLASVLSMEEYHNGNISLAQYLLDRRLDFMACFEQKLKEICSKRSFILPLLSVAIKQSNDEMLSKIFNEIKSYVMKALQKPHKAGQHFSNNYESIGVLIDKFMDSEEFGSNVQKFDVTELFHVHLLKRIYSKAEKNSQSLENMIMTFVHLLINLLKQKGAGKCVENFENICEIIVEFLSEIKNVKLCISNEPFKLFYKLCLKYGIEGDTILLKILSQLVELCVGEEDAGLILEMFLSHSLFLDVVLGDDNCSDLLNLWLILCTKWPELMEKNHVPILLSSYKATRSSGDRIILNLLKLYELKQERTCFNDFKPFLWGPAAVSHYSVRSNVQEALFRQPKMRDILNNLHQSTILETIKNPQSPISYDLDYFLPLFSHLFAPENLVAVYTFIKSGALALTLTGFMGDKSQRLGAFYVISRFHFHLDARQGGKDHLLWLRFIEVICKGVSVLDDFQVNNFVGVFLARAALVLTQPLDAMYVPLTQYLSAKDLLDFSTIPELYTFLHSPHVDSDKHRLFILEVLRDGLRTEKDFTVLSKSMGLKLISELCSNTFCDNSTKVLVLDILQSCCRISLGFKVLCGNVSFLTYISSMFMASLRKRDRDGSVLLKLLDVIREVARVDENIHRNFVLYLQLIAVCENDEYFRYVSEHKGLEVYYEILLMVVKRFPRFFSKEHVDLVLEKSKDKYCKYLNNFKCRFVKESDVCGDTTQRYLRLLFYNKLIKES